MIPVMTVRQEPILEGVVKRSIKRAAVLFNIFCKILNKSLSSYEYGGD